MSYTIENEFLIATINMLGGELSSLKSKDNNFEYIWQAEPVIWARHAPVLFPIVGKLKDNRYHYKGEVFHLPQHGFARDTQYELVECAGNKTSFTLRPNEKTKLNYKFDFQLTHRFELIGRTLKIGYSVENHGKGVMPFSVGAHPGFNLVEGTSFKDYKVEFIGQDGLIIKSFGLEGGLVGDEIELPLEGHTLQLATDSFNNDALIFEFSGVEAVKLSTLDNQYSVTIKTGNAPYFGIWSKVGQSFVCLEPWYGIADSKYSNGNLEEKKGIQWLEPKEVFNFNWAIEV